MEKIFVFLQNIHYLQKKIILYGKKIYIDFFFTEKAFLTKNEKNISHLRNIFLSRKYIFILQKNVFDHKKYIC